MAFQINTKDKLKNLNRGAGFDIALPPANSPDFSIAYLTLTDSRDPAEADKIIALNRGAALYLITDGSITFNLFENNAWVLQQLQKNENIYITPGTLYEITGSGVITFINFPAFSDDMYSHPAKPKE